MQIHPRTKVQGFLCTFLVKKYDTLPKNYSHTELCSPINGVIKSLKKTNTKVIYRGVTRDGIIENPLGGTLKISFIHKNIRTMIFQDTNYFCPKETPRLDRDNSDSNSITLNREQLRFYQKRHEPFLYYAILFREDQIIEIFTSPIKGDPVVRLQPNSTISLIVDRGIINNKNITKPIGVIRREILGVIV